MQERWSDIFVIVVTPFNEDLTIDEESLRREVDFCIEAGASGVVGPANASEFPTMSDEERRRWIQVVVEQTAGRIPVIAATTAGHRIPAVELSQFAQDVGADGVMAMPPPILSPGPQGCFDYFAALSEALSIPIIVQNFGGPAGTPMPVEIVARMCAELEHVRYIKEETLPEPRAISATLALATEGCDGVFGGQGGVYMIDEWRRGACGNMPAAQSTEVHVEIWDLLKAGKEEEARSLFNRLLPLINFERMHGVAVYKEVMRRRGIFTTPLSRAPGRHLDEADLQELDAILADAGSLFKDL